MTRQTISNWETGKSQPDIETLVTLGEVLGTDANELIYGNKTNGYIRFQKKYVAMTIVCMVIAAIAVVLDCTIFPAIKNDFNLYFYYSWWLMFATMVIRPFAVFTFGCGVVSAISMFADLSLYKNFDYQYSSSFDSVVSWYNGSVTSAPRKYFKLCMAD